MNLKRSFVNWSKGNSSSRIVFEEIAAVVIYALVIAALFTAANGLYEVFYRWAM
jgi:hypothetical protein